MAVWLLLLIGLVPTAIRAQESRGTILGTVTDSGGAVVPGANIEAVNLATSVRVPTVSNQAGDFRIPFLMPGHYKLSVQKAGFKTEFQSDIQVGVAEAVQTKIVLQVGSAVQRVEVTSASGLLQTTEASQSATIGKRELDAIPIQGGSAVELLTFAPGMSKQGELRLPYPAYISGLTMVSSDGAGMQHNNITMDGLPNESIGIPGQNGSSNAFIRPAIALSSYAVQEMKIQTNVYDASQGFTNGAVFNMVTRSGTNAWHGEAHYQFYPSSISAENPFNRSFVFFSASSQHRWGFSLGGPVVLPKVYNGHNKTFWFFSMERYPRELPSSTPTTVPTQAEINGDFSALLAVGPQYQIYDPLSIASHADLSRTPFPGNIIPTNRLDPVAQNILKFYKPPNTTEGVTADGQNNFTWIDPCIDVYTTYTTRVDHAFSDKHRLMGRFSWDNWFESGGDVFSNGTTSILGFQFRRSYVAALDDVYVLSPSLVLDVKLGATYQPYTSGPPTNIFDYRQLGFSQQLLGLISGGKSIFPTINFSQGVFQSIGAGGGYYNNNTNETLDGTLSWEKGNHSLRFGAEGWIWRQNFRNTFNNTSPAINFGGAYTNGPGQNANSAPVGQDLAEFLLGIPDSATMGISSPFTAHYDRSAVFVQDDWKVKPRLTLNLGLRWELELPTTESFNRMEIGFDPNAAPSFGAAASAAYASTGYAANAASIAAAANLDPTATANLQNILSTLPSSLTVRGGYLYAGPGHRGMWDTNWKEFMPRVGLAYQLGDNTAIRGGFGLFYDSLGIGRNALPAQDGFSRNTFLASSLDAGVTYLDSLANPFPSGLLQPVGSSLGADLSAGNSIFVGYVNAHEPYSEHWSFDVQRKLPGQLLLDVSYVGAREVDLPITNGCYISGIPCANLNNIPQKYLSTSPVFDGDNLAVLNARVPNPYAGLSAQLPNLSGATIPLQQLLSPYTQFTAIQSTQTGGTSMFHSLQARVEHRFHRGLTVSSNFTWQREMDRTNFLNGGDPHATNMINGFDPGLIFNGIGVYELPFGSGRPFGASWHGPLDWFLGGWQMSGTFKTQQGYPATLNDLLLQPGETLRDLNGLRDPESFFNVSALNTVTALQPGPNHLRTIPTNVSYLRGPGFFTADAAISKKYTIRERVTGEFRLESYNVTNHPNFWPFLSIDSANPFGNLGAQFDRRYNGLPRNFEISLRMTF